MVILVNKYKWKCFVMCVLKIYFLVNADSVPY